MMDAQFCEVLVKRKRPKGYSMLSFGCGILSAAAWLGGILSLYVPFLLAGLLFAGGAVFFWFRSQVEYEYSYVDGELRVDRILARRRRKRLMTLERDGILTVAPKRNGASLEREGAVAAIKDVSSHKEGARVYELLYEKAGLTWKVLFEPDDTMLKMMKLAMPRKITI